MKKTLHSIKTWVASGLLVASLGANAQTGQYPWGQNVDYPFGYKAAAAKTETEAKNAYDAWKAGYLLAGPSCAGAGTYRVKFDTKSERFKNKGVSGTGADIVTVSEGIAYGMLLTSYYGDETLFKGLWAYYKKHSNAATGIMNWGINNTACTVVGDNGATDAELDVAWALWVAHNQWGNGTTSQYLTDCKTMIAAIKNYEIDKSGNLNTLKPGDQFGGHGSGNNDLVNISYFSPAYYRTFGEITNDAAFWDKVYTRGYDILEKAANKTTGLVPDWCTSGGSTPASGASTYDNGGTSFFYDAVRTPARTALDYLWYGDQAPRALAYTKKVNNWLRGKHANPSSIGSQYALDGTVIQSYHNNAFVGPFTVCAMATDDINTGSYISALYADNVKTAPGGGEYFNASWKALSLFMATGNFYLPPPDACDGPYLAPDYQLCTGTGSPKTITVDCNISGANKYEWKLNGSVISGANKQTYAVSVAGNYEVSTTFTVGGKACVRRSATTVFDATPKASFSFTRSGLAVDFKNTSTGGDPYAETPTLKSAWDFGATGSPSSSTTPDGATNFSSSGLKFVTLTVTNSCGQSNAFTQAIPLPVAAGPGWVGNDFSNTSQGLFGAYTGAGVVNPNVTITTNCQFATAAVKKAMGINETVALTFKADSSTLLDHNSPMNVSNYPYARFRIKIVTTADISKLLPNGLRVDLVSWDDKGTPTNGADDVYNATGATAANVVYLKGERNADGSYKPLVANEWFVSTLSFEGKLSDPKFNVAKVTQLAFTPYNDLAANSPNRSDYSIMIDWATVGNKDIAKPNPTLVNGATYVCSTTPTYSVSGSELDSCNSESVLWADGFTKFSRTLNPGTYTVTVKNFAGSESRTVTIGLAEPAVANFSYNVLAVAPSAQLQPYDNSTGKISQWKWYRGTTATAAPSTNYTGGTSNWLYSTSVNSPQQFPGASPTGTSRPSQAIFTGTGTEYLCLVVVPTVSNCVTTSKLCTLVNWVITSTEETLTESTFAIYPTVVADNRLNVQLGTGLQGAYEVQVMNVNGKQVATAKAISGNNEINLDSNLPAGTYIVKVSQGDKTITKRFIKQ